MIDPRVKQALDSLPMGVHRMAVRIEESNGKEAAARYLKSQITLLDSTIKFKPVENPLQMKRLDTRITGKEAKVLIEGFQIPAIKTESNDTWIPRAWLCGALGWDRCRLTKMRMTGPTAKSLAFEGYSFEYLLGTCKGHRRSSIGCISFRDARIAISVLGKGKERANAA